MKITYELDSSNPDDHEDIILLHHARHFKNALEEIERRLRNWRKYEDDETYPTAAKCLEDITEIMTILDTLS